MHRRALHTVLSASAGGMLVGSFQVGVLYPVHMFGASFLFGGCTVWFFKVNRLLNIVDTHDSFSISGPRWASRLRHVIAWFCVLSFMVMVTLHPILDYVNESSVAEWSCAFAIGFYLLLLSPVTNTSELHIVNYNA